MARSLTPLALAVGLCACERAPLRAALEAKPALAGMAALPAPPPKLHPPAAPERPGEPAAAAVAAPSRGLEIAIAGGALRVGSATGTAHRNPAREADAIELTLAPFAIDALPYPNDPAEPARAGASQREAEALCGAQGKRLCSELEWERACKGQANAEYPSASPYGAAACAKEPARCHSDLGVFALGSAGREWTSSPARNGDWDRMRSVLVRGAAPDAEPVMHRCAARDAAAPESRSDTLLFRCCRGAAQTTEYPVEAELPAFKELGLESKAARDVLRAMPETSSLANDFRLHAAGSMLSALSVAGRTIQSLSPWQAASPSLRWSPLRGEELVVLSGDATGGALIVAYYPSAGGPRLAGSYQTKDEHTPILVAYKQDAREELLFSTCWGCGGEGGAMRLDAAARLRFLPR